MFRIIQWFRRLFGYKPVQQEIQVEKPMTGQKKALLVGINRYEKSGNELRGCVNDVRDMYDLLVQVFGFQPDDIRVLTDERATKQAILHRLGMMIRESRPGDVMVYHQSSHGSQVRDRNGDESLHDGLDECLISYDHDWDSPLLDDDLYELFRMIPHGVTLTFFSDTCHSGSMSRSIFEQQPRFLEPPFDIAARSRHVDLEKVHIGVGRRSLQDVTVVDDFRHMLFSGCRDNQTSADAHFKGVWNGAMTRCLIDTLKENPQATWKEVHRVVIQKLQVGGFNQVPQLTGPSNMLNGKPFGG